MALLDKLQKVVKVADPYSLLLEGAYGLASVALGDYLTERTYKSKYSDAIKSQLSEDLFSIGQRTKHLESDLGDLYASSGLMATYFPKTRALREETEKTVKAKYGRNLKSSGVGKSEIKKILQSV